MVAVLDEMRCNRCRECLRICPTSSLTWVASDGLILIDPWACSGCGTCTTSCPSDAIHLVTRARP